MAIHAKHRVVPSAAGDPAPARGEVTLYVPGFTRGTRSGGELDAWRATHAALVRRAGWGPVVAGYAWRAGTHRLPKLVLLRWSRAMWRAARGTAALTPAGAALLVAEGTVEYGAWMLLEYRAARRAAHARATELAAELRALRSGHAYVRVVAHSLGCRHLVEATAALAAAELPDEVHLCGAAFSEAEYAPRLAALAGGTWYLYYVPTDAVLGVLYRLAEGGSTDAAGRVGLAGAYPRVQAVDVAAHFGLRVHHDYRRRFAAFARTPAATREA